MEIDLSQKTIDMLADAVAMRLRKGQQTIRKGTKEYVRTAEAARILGVTPNYLRQVKDRYPHKKTAGTKQGTLLFERDGLI